MTTAAEAQQKTFDGARSAIALIRALRRSDAQAALDLTRTMDREELGYLCGALASLTNQALNVAEDASRLAGSDVTTDDILTVMTLGFVPDDDGQLHD
jgi:hypothetical protein